MKGLLGAAPIGAAAENAASSSAAVVAAERDYFQELGVETFINALAPYSSLGGNQMWPEVIEAMDYAMHRRARMKDLHDAAGKRIASLIGCEAAMVSAGATSAITPPGKPPPLAVRLEEALPFRRVIDDLLSMNREVQKRRSTCESGKANRT